ncbi:uncharacterized protein [Macrobrachium rosenbergii]|uniref:uncharacterized protein isoform X1 n=1 Tax=Macrobrachium rosenbergii TaxID=79674 RepID=UPI0034D51D58
MTCMGASCSSLAGEVSTPKVLSVASAISPMKVAVIRGFRLSSANLAVFLMLLMITSATVVPVDQEEDKILSSPGVGKQSLGAYHSHRWLVRKERTTNITMTKPNLDFHFRTDSVVTGHKNSLGRFMKSNDGQTTEGHQTISPETLTEDMKSHQQPPSSSFSKTGYFVSDISSSEFASSTSLQSKCKQGILIIKTHGMSRKVKSGQLMRCGNYSLRYPSMNCSIHGGMTRKSDYLDEIRFNKKTSKSLNVIECIHDKNVREPKRGKSTRSFPSYKRFILWLAPLRASYHLPQVNIGEIDCNCVTVFSTTKEPHLPGASDQPEFRQRIQDMHFIHLMYDHQRFNSNKTDKIIGNLRRYSSEKGSSTRNVTSVVLKNDNSTTSGNRVTQKKTFGKQNHAREKRFVLPGAVYYEKVFSRKGKWSQKNIIPSRRRNYGAFRGQRGLSKEKPLWKMSRGLDKASIPDEKLWKSVSRNLNNGERKSFAARKGNNYWIAIPPLQESINDRKRNSSRSEIPVMNEHLSSDEKKFGRTWKRENGKWTWKELTIARRRSSGKKKELPFVPDKKRNRETSFFSEMTPVSLAEKKLSVRGEVSKENRTVKSSCIHRSQTHPLSESDSESRLNGTTPSYQASQNSAYYRGARIEKTKRKVPVSIKECREENGGSYDGNIDNKSLDKARSSRVPVGYSGASESSIGIDESLETNFLNTKNSEDAETFHGDQRSFSRSLGVPRGRQKMMGRRHKRKIDISSVSVVEGEDAALPCDLRSADPDDSVQIILWIKEGLHTPLYSYDFRELLRGQPKETKPDANSTLSRRTSFRTDRSPAALIIQKTEMDDAGIYRCRVDFRHSPTLNYRVNLTVIVAPTTVSISWYTNNSSPKTVVGEKAGPFLEHTQPTIVCKNSDGWPPPSVIWYENDKVLDDSYVVDYEEGVVVNDLVFPTITRDDLGRNLTCIASNTKRSPPAVKSIAIDMTLRIIGVKLINPGTIWADERSRAVCQIWGSKPPPNVVWWLGSLMLPPAETKISDDDRNVTLSYLDFIPAADDDEAMLICQATNEMLPDQAVQDSTILVVNYAPLVSVHLGRSLDPDKIKEGDDVYFECTVISKPPVFNVIWKHNGVELVEGSGIILSNMSLVVQGVTRSHGGNYTCHATNVRNTSASPPLHLDVKYTPVCASEQRQQHSVGKQENAEISCKVDANPKVVSFRWTFNNTAEAIDVPEGRFVVVGTESRVNYTPMNELDYGTLLCWANNSIGMQQHPCVFQIVAAGKPDPPHNCRVFDVTISSLQVQCLPGDDGGLNQMFILHLYKIGSVSPIAELSRASPSFTINNLRPATSYRIVIASVNEKGTSRLTELNAYTVKVLETLEETSAEPARDRVRGTGFPLAAILGIIGAVVSVALASVVLVWFRVCRNVARDEEGNEGSAGSGSEANANSHSSQSKEPATTEFAVSETSLQTTCHHDVQQLADPSWSGEVALIATISGPPYVVTGSEKQYSTITGAPAPSSQVGVVPYAQFASQGTFHPHLQCSSEVQLQTPARKVPHVPYYTDSAQHEQFPSTLEQQLDPKEGYHVPTQTGEKLYPYDPQVNTTGKDQDEVFPPLFHILPESISKSSQSLSHCSIHHCQKDHVSALDSSSLPPVNLDMTRRGSLKRLAQQRSMSPQSLLASAQSNQSMEDLTKRHRKYPLTVDLLTASLNRTKYFKKERPLKVADSQSCQQLIHTIPSSQRKNKMESAV